MLQLAEDERWPAGWVFDGRKNMYSPLELDGKTARQNTLSQEAQEFKVSLIQDHFALCKFLGAWLEEACTAPYGCPAEHPQPGGPGVQDQPDGKTGCCDSWDRRRYVPSHLELEGKTARQNSLSQEAQEFQGEL